MFGRLIVLAADATPMQVEMMRRINILIGIGIVALVALVSIWLGQLRLAKNQKAMAELLKKQNRD